MAHLMKKYPLNCGQAPTRGLSCILCVKVCRCPGQSWQTPYDPMRKILKVLEGPEKLLRLQCSMIV